MLSLESENPAITITALLASLNSCCNPWIYMFFSGHLLQDCVQSFLCCDNMKQAFNKEDSDSMSRRQTSYTINRSPTNSMGTWKDSPKSSKFIKFIPVSTWAPHSCNWLLGQTFLPIGWIQLIILRTNELHQISICQFVGYKTAFLVAFSYCYDQMLWIGLYRMIIKTCYTKMFRPNSQKYNKFLKEI